MGPAIAIIDSADFRGHSKLIKVFLVFGTLRQGERNAGEKLYSSDRR